MDKTVESVNFGRIADVDLADIPALADCNPGMEPVEYNVIMAPATMPEKKGSIFIPDSAKDQLGLAQQVGRLVAISPLAFNFDHWPEDARKPQVGDVVWYARYAGGLFTGRDGREYRIFKDKDIGGVIQRAPQRTPLNAGVWNDSLARDAAGKVIDRAA